MAYTDLFNKLQVTKKSEEQHNKTTAKPFSRWVLNLSDLDSDSKGQKHPVCVFPSSFCAMSYISDKKSLRCERTERRFLDQDRAARV